jgi:hypothetical protein
MLGPDRLTLDPAKLAPTEQAAVLEKPRHRQPIGEVIRLSTHVRIKRPRLWRPSSSLS